MLVSSARVGARALFQDRFSRRARTSLRLDCVHWRWQTATLTPPRSFRGSRRATEHWRDVISTEPSSTNLPYQSSYVFFQKAAGAFLTDLDGHDYIDFNNGSGSVFLGHGHAAVNAALIRSLQDQSTTLTGPQEASAALAKRLLRDLPPGQLAGFFTTGTEAVRAAVDVAKRATGRAYVLSAGYHGWDSTWQAGAGNRPFAINHAGVVDFFYVLDVAERFFKRHPSSVAAVVISPHPEYLSAGWYRRLSELARTYGALLISDEVKQGYRYRSGPLLHNFQISADLYAFSKIIANGHRIAAVCGAEAIMHSARGMTHTSVLDSLHANAAIATLDIYDAENAAEKVLQEGTALMGALKALLRETELPIELIGDGCQFQFVVSDKDLESAFYSESVAAGVIFTPCDVQTPSLALDGEVRDMVEARIGSAMKKLAHEYRHERGKPVALRSRLEAACRALHGFPEYAHSAAVKCLR